MAAERRKKKQNAGAKKVRGVDPWDGVLAKIIFSAFHRMKLFAEQLEGIGYELRRETFPIEERAKFVNRLNTLLTVLPERFFQDQWDVDDNSPDSWKYLVQVAKASEYPLLEVIVRLSDLNGSQDRQYYLTVFQQASAVVVRLAEELQKAIDALELSP